MTFKGTRLSNHPQTLSADAHGVSCVTIPIGPVPYLPLLIAVLMLLVIMLPQ